MSEANDFVQRFQRYWRAPSPEGLAEILAKEVRLVTPLARTAQGLPAAQKWARGLLRRLPDLTAQVHRWSAFEGGVFIEFTLSATLAGKPLVWDAVDRFLLADGMAVERVAYFDALPIVRAVLTRPSAWFFRPAAPKRLTEESHKAVVVREGRGTLVQPSGDPPRP